MAGAKQGWRNAVIPKQDFVSLFSQISNSDIITNTTDEKSLLGNGIGVLDVPANGFKVGDSFLLNMSGLISCQNGDLLTINIYGGNSPILLATTGALTLKQSTDKVYILNAQFVIREIGIPTIASIITNFYFSHEEDSANKVETKMVINENNTTFDTTLLNQLRINAQWGQAKNQDKIQSKISNLYKIF